MTNECLQFCNATADGVAENKINDVKCPCLTCMGAKRMGCDTNKMSAELQIEIQILQRMRCSKCKYYNSK